jgi:uracil-DNA glycosylase
VSEASALLARYLRQRGEMGDREIVLAADPAALFASLRDRERVGAPRPVGATREPSVRRGRTAPAPALAPPLPSPRSLDPLREEALACTRCPLAATRTSVVFGEGDPSSGLVVVGEAPGAEEDRSGRPFVGRAGELLEVLLRSAGFERESVYICNVLKCRPPGNRNPLPEEVEACSPFLRRQIEGLSPRVVLAAGGFAAQTLLGTDLPIGRLRGEVHQVDGVAVVPTYHPAALLRNSAWIRLAWEDLQRARALLQVAR